MIIDILKLARPRTWPFIVLSFTIGWLLTGVALSLEFFAGLLIYIILVANVNLVNAYTDIEEDKLNLPHRVRIIERVGPKKIIFVAAALYLIATFIAIFLPFWFLIIYLIALFDTIFYSLPPLRFKARHIIGMIAFAGAVFFPALGAWTLYNDIITTPIIIFFLGYWFITYGTIKNLPDYEGDKRIGLRTSATIFDTRKKAVMFAVTLLLSPYLILLFLLLFNLIEFKFVYLFLGLPLVSFVCYKALKAKAYQTLEKMHTYGLVYAVIFLALTLFIISLTIYSVIFLVLLLSILFLILKTRFDSR
ncbi:MAG: UbiA prenyltransferase family protein [Candidatus Aenigmatarchaeota archaeon]